MDWNYKLFLNGYYYKGYGDRPTNSQIGLALKNFRDSDLYEEGTIEVDVGRLYDGFYLVDCKECGGSGFSGYGSGYDDVCGTCGGSGEHPIYEKKIR